MIDISKTKVMVRADACALFIVSIDNDDQIIILTNVDTWCDGCDKTVYFLMINNFIKSLYGF